MLLYLLQQLLNGSKTKAVGIQMQKVHGGDKLVDPALKPMIPAKREGIPKTIPVMPKLVALPQMILPPLLPRKGQGRAGARRKTIGPRLKPIPQLQPSYGTPPLVPCRPEFICSHTTLRRKVPSKTVQI